MAAFSEKFLTGEEFETVSAIFCCYEYVANATETVEKIATD